MTYHNGTASHKNHYFYLDASAQFVQGNSLTIIGNATKSGYLFPEDCLCQVKIVTSIATSNLNLLDGSSFGADDLNTSPVPELQWFGAQKGYSNDTLVPGGGLVEYSNAPGRLGTAPIILCVPNASNNSTEETTGVNLATNVSQDPSTFCPR